MLLLAGQMVPIGTEASLVCGAGHLSSAVLRLSRFYGAGVTEGTGPGQVVLKLAIYVVLDVLLIKYCCASPFLKAGHV